MEQRPQHHPLVYSRTSASRRSSEIMMRMMMMMSARLNGSAAAMHSTDDADSLRLAAEAQPEQSPGVAYVWPVSRQDLVLSHE